MAKRVESEPGGVDGDRDYVMARLAAARSCAQEAIEAIDEAVALFVSPDEDKKGKERDELIDSALEATGRASRALEFAVDAYGDVDPSEPEPWEV